MPFVPESVLKKRRAQAAIAADKDAASRKRRAAAPRPKATSSSSARRSTPPSTSSRERCYPTAARSQEGELLPASGGEAGLVIREGGYWYVAEGEEDPPVTETEAAPTPASSSS